MAEFVLDSSVALSWCFPRDPTEDTPYSRHVLAKLSMDDAIVPAVWPFEIANIIFVAFQKRKRSTQKDIDDYLQLLRALPIRVEYRDLRDTVTFEHIRDIYEEYIGARGVVEKLIFEQFA